ncbi:MAG: filamentation induced by cAMP protein Fic [Anaeromyxobacteraceae bacterium]|jgi:Fic family protein|nr:filamentation induced by cAMP protein Fic [Anaeromyxobacteraceae bacterium]
MRTRYLDLDDRTQDLNERMREDPDLANDFLQKYELSWVYHENALEGVVYTIHELVAGLAAPQPVADAMVIGVLQEVRNHKAAIDLVRSEAAAKKARVNLTLVKKIHETLYKGIQSKGPSEFRKDMPLHRAYFHEIAQPAKIPALLAKVVDATDTADFRKSHPVMQAAKVQHGFMQVYPYTDGSGKIARLLSNLYLIHGGFLPCVIHSIDRQRYYDSFKMPEAVLRDLMIEAMDNALGHAEKHFSEAPPSRTRRAAR